MKKIILFLACACIFCANAMAMTMDGDHILQINAYTPWVHLWGFKAGTIYIDQCKPQRTSDDKIKFECISLKKYPNNSLTLVIDKADPAYQYLKVTFTATSLSSERTVASTSCGKVLTHGFLDKDLIVDFVPMSNGNEVGGSLSCTEMPHDDY